MNKLQLPQAKLFYAVGELYRKRMIDQNERRLLKEKIITDNVQIFQILQQNDTESVLLDRLVELVRFPQKVNSGNIRLMYSGDAGKEQSNGHVEDNGNGNANASGRNGIVPVVPAVQVQQEEASSPWGQFLRKKKYGMKGQQHGQQVKQLKSLIKPEKAD